MYNSSGKFLISQEMEGPTLDACKEELYKQYSFDYDILDWHTEIKSKFFGLSHKPVVHVKYVVKDNRVDSVSSVKMQRDYPKPNFSRPQVSVPQQAYSSYHAEDNDYSRAAPVRNDKDSFNSEREKILEKQFGVPAKDVLTSFQMKDLSSKIERMQSMVEKMTTDGTAKSEHATIEKIAKLLEQNEFTTSYIDSIKNKIREKFSLEDLEDFELVKDSVVDWIGEGIQIAPRYECSKPPHVIIIVGPTGVGKTTTLAKIAAAEKLSAKRNDKPLPKMQIITTDTMRVAAVEQIEHYAEALDLRAEKVSNCDELTTLFKNYNSPDVDFIFIDTSGFSPNDHKNIAKMKDVLSVKNMHADVYLAVSASTKAKDLEKILLNYAPFDFRSVIVTKCDETFSYGNVLSVLHEHDKKISWITLGQEILHKMVWGSPLYFLKNLDGFNVNEKHINSKFGSNESDN